MTSLVLIAILVSAVSAVFAEPGLCPKVKTVHNFKIKEFAGRWYEIQRYPTVFEAETKCVTADYYLNNDGSVSIMDSSVYESINEELKMKARGIPEHDNSANLTVQYDRLPGKWNYLVLDTDYKSYSLVYACKQSPEDDDIAPTRIEYAWILSRTPYLSSRVVSKLTKKLQQYDSNVDNFKKTDQINCDHK